MAERRQRQSHNTKRLPASVVVLAAVFIAGVGYIAGTFNTQIISTVGPLFGLRAAGATLDLSSLQDTYRALKANYDGELDDAKLVEGANKGLVDAVGDQYTIYMNQTESQEFDDALTGSIGGGIGAEIGMRAERPSIVRLLKDNPAEKAGLKVGDIIVGINGESTANQTVDQAVAKIRGEVGTTVKLSVLRGDENLDFTVTRAQITNPSVYTTVTSDGIGVLSISRFDGETGDLAVAAAKQFKSQGVKAVILDLRGNGGGYLTAAQDVASLWLDKKLVVTERTGGRVVDELTSGSNPILAGMPTVVLVDGSTASASEIVAGALKDHDVATLIGEQTYGKGSVQKLIDLPDAAQLKVTVARWYTPSGKNISEQGIAPDKEVGRTADDVNAGRDPQLDAAKEALR